VRYLFLLLRSALAVAAVAALAAVPAAAVDTQPKVLIDAPFTLNERPFVVFIPDGAKALAAASVGARLRVMEDHSFTISGGSLPPIVGRWGGIRNDETFMLSLWAKTDQVNLNGTLYAVGANGLAIDVFVQVNAPRTDGGAAPSGGPLPPTSLWTIETLVPPTAASGSAQALARVAALADDVPAPAADTQPKVLVDVPFTIPEQPFVVFVPDGAKALATASVGARLRLLSDLTFTISGGSLPPMVGRWGGVRTDTTFMLGLWAKTDQVNFNATLTPIGANGLGIDYHIEVNAPRSDGGDAPPGGSLPPTSLWMMQMLRRPVLEPF
jgi:hypothetical protein